TLAIAVIGFLWVWPLLHRDSSKTEAPVPSAREVYDETVAEGRRALAEGSFALALEKLSAAVRLRDGRPDLHDATDRRSVNQLYWQSFLLAKRLDRPLVDLLKEANKLPDDPSWQAHFDLHYHGK